MPIFSGFFFFFFLYNFRIRVQQVKHANPRWQNKRGWEIYYGLVRFQASQYSPLKEASYNLY